MAENTVIDFTGSNLVHMPATHEQWAKLIMGTLLTKGPLHGCLPCPTTLDLFCIQAKKVVTNHFSKGLLPLST